MTSISVPIAQANEVSEQSQTDSALPAIICLSTITLVLVVILLLWISIIDDPGGGQPRISVEIQTDSSRLILGPVGVANVRPSMTPDPEDFSVDLPPQSIPATRMQTASPTASGEPTDMPDPPREFSTTSGATKVDSTHQPPESTHPDAQRLSVFPLENMVTRGEYGLIPKRASNGRTPFAAYSRPQQFIPEGPKIALIVGGVGLSQSATEKALVDLPPTMALGFASYGENLEKWKKLSRENGFELLMEVPMEPFNYPQNDPGPHTLLVDATAAENRTRLEWVLSRTSNYIGIVPSMGSRFTSHEAALTQLATDINLMGLGFIDPSNSVRSIASQIIPRASSDQLGHLPFLKVDVVLDGNSTRASMEQNLIRLEELSNSKGMAVGYTQLRPATVDILSEWSQMLEQRGVTLIPLSAAINLSMPEL